MKNQSFDADLIHIRRTYELAQAAAKRGNHPFGALLVHDGAIILEIENTVVTERDATRHAELNLVSEACRQFDPDTRMASTLYTSTEPCAMCMGAIFWAGIANVVYGCSSDALAAWFEINPELHTHRISPIALSGPVLQEEGSRIHAAFWPAFLARTE
jgi:tRNA(Arg) A34 adenosine deaminase TadA